MDIKLVDHSKLLLAARYWLLGMAECDERYFRVLDAMEMMLRHHTGKRNGGQPASIHQLGIFHRLRTLHKHLKNPITVYILAFLHDVLEDARKDDAGVKHYIHPDEIENVFGKEILRKVKLLSKEIIGVPNPEYNFMAIFEDEDAGPAKFADRDNNVSTMVGVFKPDRLRRYVLETADDFIPQAKVGRRLFPHQESVYENLKLGIINQLQLIVYIMDQQEQNATTETTETTQAAD